MKNNKMYLSIHLNELNDKTQYESLEDAVASMKKVRNSESYGYAFIVKVEKIFEINVKNIEFKEVFNNEK